MSKKDKPSINTGGGAYIGGSVSVTGGKLVGRDDLAGQPATLEDFTRLLAELRGILAEARLDTDNKDAVDADFKVVEAQVQKPEPKRGLIETKLKSIAGVLGGADKAAGAAQGLIEKGAALAATLAVIAAQVF